MTKIFCDPGLKLLKRLTMNEGQDLQGNYLYLEMGTAFPSVLFIMNCINNKCLTFFIETVWAMGTQTKMTPKAQWTVINEVQKQT